MRLSVKYIIYLLLLYSSQAYCQVSHFNNGFEKGYVKDGKKVSFWEYYDDGETLDLKINYNNGTILYLKPDSSYYVIKYNNEWQKVKPTIYPRMVGSLGTLYRQVCDNMDYPTEARRNKAEGLVVITFSVDSLGHPYDFVIQKDIGHGCGEEALQNVKQFVPKYWIPAKYQGQAVVSRFAVPFIFQIGGKPRRFDLKDEIGLFNAFSEIVIIGYGEIKKITAGAKPWMIHSPPELDLSDQSLTELADDIFLEDYRVIDLRNNDLSNLPNNFKRFSPILEIHLDNNELDSLPSEFQKLKFLNVLSLTNNKFRYIPYEIYELKRLKGLDLSNNSIESISPGIIKLKNLKILALANNQITQLPMELFEMKHLEKLFLEGNQLAPEIKSQLKASLADTEIVFD